MKRTSESNGNNQNPGININENGRITVNNSVSNLSNLPGEVKEHKADCVPYVRAENKFPTQNESKDGYQKEKGPKNIEFSSSFDQTTVQKISGNGKERTSENNANERETILALHDLTIAYKDYSTGKKTSDKSLLYGKSIIDLFCVL